MFDGQFFPYQPIQFQDGLLAPPFADAGLLSNVGSFNTGTGANGTTVGITDLGFQPKAIIFFWSGNTGTADAVAGIDGKFGMGFATSTAERSALTVFSDDAVATTAEGGVALSDCCVAMMATDTTMDGKLDLQSLDADGFTLVVDDQFTANYRVQYLAIGGPSVQAKTNLVTISTGTGAKNFTDPGFDPDGLIFLIGGTGTPGTINVFNIFSLGVYDGTTQGVVSGRTANGAAAGQTRTYNRIGDEILAYGSTVAGLDRRGIASFITNGFSINMTNAVGSNVIAPYLALAGLNVKVGALQTRTDGANIVVTGLGFQPSAVMFFSNGIAQSAAFTNGNEQRYSIGAASGPAERVAASVYNRNLADPTQVAAAVEHDEVYINLGTADNVQGLMDLVSFDSDGFTCVMDDADPSAAQVIYMAVG